MTTSGTAASPQREPRTITLNVASTQALNQRCPGTYNLSSPAEVKGISVDWDSQHNVRILLLGPEATPRPPEVGIRVYVGNKPVDLAAGPRRTSATQPTLEPESDPHYYELPETVTVTSVSADFIDDKLRLTLNPGA